MSKSNFTLRPSKLEDYVGQKKLKEKLSLFMSAASARSESMDHLLIYGPPGLGKTTIARVIAKEMNSTLKITSGPVLDKVGDIASILMSLKDNDFLFIDEIHRINKSVEEVLYPAMEDRTIDVVIGKGTTAKSVRFNLKKFTIIGATTRASMLSAPLRDRFGFSHRIEYYTVEDLTNIVKNNCNIFKIDISNEAAEKIAESSRGTPRIANKLLKRVRDYAQVKMKDGIDISTANAALKVMEIDSFGLDELDRAMLKVIIDKYDGGPVGLNTLAMTLGEDKHTIEEVHEPYLVKVGLIERTSRGRKVTKDAYSHIRKMKDENI